jgi:formylglycine-generating enzyme required for sulfatase activity
LSSYLGSFIVIEIRGPDSTGEAEFWEAAKAPSWASDWGWDDYGAWVEFELAGKDGKPVTQRMRWIEPGRFQMGSPEDEPERTEREGPQHDVEIRNGFWLFDTACTQALWEAVMGKNPSHFTGPDRPVEQVSWNYTQRFLKTINKRVPGLALSLPSEAQWEYACRAGTSTAFNLASSVPLITQDGQYLVTADGARITLGNPLIPEQVNYNGNYPYAGGKKGLFREETLPVEELSPNDWGLYQMHGNVWEWVQDHWHDSYERAPTDGSAWLDADAAPDALRVIRGGSWDGRAQHCRSAFRHRSEPDNRDYDLGFRPARVHARELEQDGMSGALEVLAARPAERGGARGRDLAARSDGQGGLAAPEGESSGPPAVVLRLENAAVASAPLPAQAQRLEVRTDREVLTLRRTPRPGWASAMGRDRFGLWADLRIEVPSGAPLTQRLRWIPPGRFQMGSPEDEPGRVVREGPRHTVMIGQGFWLFDTPCTQVLWEAVMGKNPSRFQSPDRPVEQIRWKDAQAFLKALNGRFEKHRQGVFGDEEFVLPSEAQWEYACRAGTETALYNGPIAILGEANAPALDPIAWYGGNSSEGFELENGLERAWLSEVQYSDGKAGSHPVGQKEPNVWGLYDMLGNVWEWVQDHWHESYKGAPADGLAWLDPDAAPDAARVIRGGSWSDCARYCRSAYRNRYVPGHRDNDLGFRPARVQVS